MEYDPYDFHPYEAEDIIQGCVVPSLLDVAIKIMYFVIGNVLFAFFAQVSISYSLFHCMSSIIGLILTYCIIETSIIHFLTFLLITFLIIWISYHFRPLQTWLQYVAGPGCILYILFCEFSYSNEEGWNQSKGLFMVATMKIISLISDFSSSRVKKFSLPAYFGYILCPSNSILGPWIPYEQYLNIYQRPPIKMDWQWWQYLTWTLLKSLFFLTLSNCWGSYLVPDDYNTWIVAYRSALSFRSSHYFISYLSETTMFTAGFRSDRNIEAGRGGYEITNFSKIEFPHSLVSVIINWNIPMHRFLKKYIYNRTVRFGRFCGILTTFMVSSLLHGLNLQLSTVLITIGLFSYIQVRFQSTLARQTNACLNVHKCTSCTHKYKITSKVILLCRVVLICLNVCNLIALGVLMDFSHSTVGIVDKWSNLNFLPHKIMASLFLYCVFTGN